MESKSRGVPDTPPEPVIGLAEGEYPVTGYDDCICRNMPWALSPGTAPQIF
jgi:hypothetical protein